MYTAFSYSVAAKRKIKSKPENGASMKLIKENRSCILSGQ